MGWMTVGLLPKGMLAVFTLMAAASAQDVGVPTLKTGIRVVAVSAVVRDKSGRLISNLTRDNFILKQEGKPQEILYFSQGSDLPLTLALVVDTSYSQISLMPDQIAAGRVFFPAVMTKPQDRGVLVQFDCTVKSLSKMTTSVPTLVNALEQVRPMTPDFTCEGYSGGSRIYDAIVAVSGNMGLSDHRDRRAMVIVTDGDDHGSSANSALTIEAAQRADIVIYSVYSGGLGGREDRLEELSTATGGRVYTVSKTMSLQQVFAEISDDHKIDLMTKDHALIVQARKAYFTPK